jgi:hypothetical protein
MTRRFIWKMPWQAVKWPLVGVLLCSACGCASVKQVQYFEVVGDPDPVTGIAEKGYYRMTVKGQGSILNHYKMKAAYVSTAAIDVLNGKPAEIPVIDIPPDNQYPYDLVKHAYLQSLVDYSRQRAGLPSISITPPVDPSKASPTAPQVVPIKSVEDFAGELEKHADLAKEVNEKRRKAGLPEILLPEPTLRLPSASPAPQQPSSGPPTPPPLAPPSQQPLPAATTGLALSPNQQEELSIALARQQWFASLSNSDLVSMGLVQTADPYRFRKLVFYASAQNIELERLAGEIDSIMAKTTTLAEAFKAKQAAEKEKDAAQKQAELNRAKTFIDSSSATPEQKALLKALLGLP